MINKKGRTGIDVLGIIAISFVVAGITLTIGSKVVSDVQSNLETGQVNASCAAYGTGCNYTDPVLAITNLSNGLGSIAEQLPLIGTIIGLAIIVGFVLMLRR